MNTNRFFNAPIEDEGTPESEWATADLAFPEFSLEGCERLVVVAAHPDDEVLGVGGLAAIAVAQGIDVQVIIVTDGQSSHPDSPTLRPDQVAVRRRAESIKANAVLGLGVPVHLGFVDGEVAGHEDDVAEALRAYVTGGWCLVTWSGDGHPDHEATARAARKTCAVQSVQLLEYPVWMWHWAKPADPEVPWGKARRVELPPSVESAKKRATAEFVTQIEPLSADPADAIVLPPFVLDRLLRTFEIVFAADSGTAAAP